MAATVNFSFGHGLAGGEVAGEGLNWVFEFTGFGIAGTKGNCKAGKTAFFTYLDSAHFRYPGHGPAGLDQFRNVPRSQWD